MSRNRSKKWGGKADPHAAREAQKYDNPIPSRELILEHLETHGAMNRERLARDLGLADEEQIEALRRRLRAMERDGQLIYNRRGVYAPASKVDLIRGRVIAHPDGFGFLVPDDGSEDLFISAREMRTLMHGDRAMVHVVGVDRRGRRMAAVVEVLERSTHQIVGRYFEEGGIGFVASENKRITHDLLIPPDAKDGAKPGQIVVADVVEQPTRHSQPIGRIREVLGEHMAPGMEIDVAIRAHELPSDWPDDLLEEVGEIPDRVEEKAKRGRVDLREVPLVTIDGADARDFDDAVYAQRTAKGWKLIVAIADVSHYVRPDSPLDREGYRRGNSVYFPGQVIPMLPEKLSNGLCSINPEVDRLCMAAEILVDRQGKVVRTRFMRGVMRSHARLIYEDVAAMLVARDPELRERYAHVLPHLEELYALYKVLAKARNKRGAIDFETTETRIEFGENRKIEQIVPVERTDAHRLIEECMILANVCAARFLLRHRMPTLFRIHERPDAETIDDLRSFLAELGLTLKGGDNPEPRHYAELLREIKGRPEAHLVQTVMLRSLKQAVYSPDNIGHFGLAQEAYLHFTSPIRRYPDLLVHRAIGHILDGGKSVDFHYTKEEIRLAGEHCSTTERRADEATRDVVSWLKCEYMQDKVGETFDGLITGVTSFGIFVELDQIFVEGLVHITALGNDFFHFDPVGHRLTGERTRQIFRLGDKVRVRVVRVDLDERKIDFELEDGPERRPESGRGGRKGKRSEGRKGGGRGRRQARSAPEPAPEQPVAEVEPVAPAESAPVPAEEGSSRGSRRRRAGRREKPALLQPRRKRDESPAEEEQAAPSPTRSGGEGKRKKAGKKAATKAAARKKSTKRGTASGSERKKAGKKAKVAGEAAKGSKGSAGKATGESAAGEGKSRSARRRARRRAEREKGGE